MNIRLCTAKTQSLIEKMSVNYRYVDHFKFEEWCRNSKVFFLVSVGRSGTQFLSTLLNGNESAVFHEPVKSDVVEFRRSSLSDACSRKYVNEFRLKDIYFRHAHSGRDIYGEVNSYLRVHCQSLRLALPNCTQIQLVRDGRDVVRSMMSRKIFDKKSWSTNKIGPILGDDYFEKWDVMSPFEKRCWIWTNSNRRIRDSNFDYVRLEDCLTDYEYFDHKILQKVDINVDEENWEKARLLKSKNSTASHQFARYDNWSKAEKQIFERICGSEMAAYGYSF
jgi:hypothetical protein